MRFIIMHKANAGDEAGALPSRELIDEVGQMVTAMNQAGVLRAGDGLRPSSEGVRLDFVGGKRTATPGPFAKGNELPAGFCIVKVKSIDEAIEWATRLAGILGDSQLDIRPMTEPWHLGMVPKPKDVTTVRYMIARKADRDSEAGVPMAADRAAAMAQLIAEMNAKGVLLAAEALQPSSKAVRLKFTRDKPMAVIDGPFTESKELIGGFVIVDVASRAEAVKWTEPYGKALGEVEIDVRPIAEPRI
jgi:hypothetical protein